jgi:hypothetical protein
VNVTVFAVADYWSDGPKTHLPTNDPPVFDDQARIDTGDSWDVRTGVRLTVGLPSSLD